MFRKRSMLGVITPPSASLIPMSLADPRFAGNTPGSAGSVFNTAVTLQNQDFIESPGYASGNPCFSWASTSGANVMNKCRVDWREGPRIICANSTMKVDQCFINCVGFTTDHADGMQAFGANPGADLTATNTCMRSFSTAEAIALYGASATGSDAIFWADTSGGSVTLDNVLIWGGDRGTAIYADTGTTVHVSFNNVFFAPGQFDPTSYFPGGFDVDIRSTGGTMVVDRWTNVFKATVVGGVIIPGAAIPHP